MTKYFMNLPAIALAVGLAIPAAAQDVADAETVVATVNGTEITLGHVILVRATLPEQYDQLPTDVLFTGIIDQLVQQTLLSQTDSATETPRVVMAMENERRALLATGVIGEIADAALTDEALRAAYEVQFASDELGQEYNASHILVESEEEAQAITLEIRNGADFAETAKSKSTGPSGPGGGSLGWFGAGMMVQPFQDAVETLEIGQVSDPVKTQFGWHIIVLNETRQKDAPAFEEVRGQLVQEVQQTAVKSYVDELTAGADVTRVAEGALDSSLINNMALLED